MPSGAGASRHGPGTPPGPTTWTEAHGSPEPAGTSSVPPGGAPPPDKPTAHHPHLHRARGFSSPPSALAQRTATQQAQFATRFAGQLFTGGAALSIVLGAVLGINGRTFSAAWFAVYGMSAVGLAAGLTLIALPRPAPPGVLILVPSAAAGLVTVAMAIDRSSALSGMVLLTWPVLFAGYLLPRRAAWWTLGVVLGCLAIVVAAGGGPNERANFVELATSVTLTLVVILRLRRQADHLREALAEQARTDDLTGLANRRAFVEALDREYARYRRYRRPLSLLAIDVDHFKLVNDTWGHAAGDAALRRLANMLTANVRSFDVVGRIGGEEFAVLMPDCGARQAASRADILRAAVHNGAPTWEHPITVSIGVATIPDGASTPEQLHDAADGALYRAKGAGRDRVEAAPDRPDE
jgi:diguanylate cyclase (GGDEF)-like protein